MNLLLKKSSYSLKSYHYLKIGVQCHHKKFNHCNLCYRRWLLQAQHRNCRFTSVWQWFLLQLCNFRRECKHLINLDIMDNIFFVHLTVLEDSGINQQTKQINQRIPFDLGSSRWTNELTLLFLSKTIMGHMGHNR